MNWSASESTLSVRETVQKTDNSVANNANTINKASNKSIIKATRPTRDFQRNSVLIVENESTIRNIVAHKP